MEMSPYLAFPGTCETAFAFYAEVFGGSVDHIEFVRDSPLAADLPPERQDYVLHSHVNIGTRLLLGSDNCFGGETAISGVYIQVAFDDLAKARRVYARLAKDGSEEMAFGRTVWAAGFGICRDRFGVLWIISCDIDAGAE